ncbi:carbohydrate sulfotransferase 11-like [Mya arenaria]|uniref:carbohydrate sulfotransferase 11-like n=1 Tax=Mya arenaria TaxID=6604 RepID=UPI0022E0FDB8|nr:carbohydrate sulfotransferase 11-like [Mya arenaria]
MKVYFLVNKLSLVNWRLSWCGMRRFTKTFLALLAVTSLLMGGLYLSSFSSLASSGFGLVNKARKPAFPGNSMVVESSFNTEMKKRVNTLRQECNRLQANGSSFQSIEKSKLDHIIVDDRYQTLYCYVPKVACTNLKRVFLLLTGKMNVTNPLELPAGDVHGSYDTYLRYLDSFPAAGVKYRLNNYKKIMFVREPLERLLSAYRNKFMQRGNEYFKEKFGKKIVKLYRENPSNLSLEKGHDVEFPEFVQYFVDPKTLKTRYNEHWAPFFDLCHPCHLKYNFIGKYETIDEDVAGLLKILKADRLIHFPDRGDSYKTKKTEDILTKFYEGIQPHLVEKIIQIYAKDYNLFGYEQPM